MTAKTFQQQCAQGDTYFRRVDAIPEGAKLVEKWDGVVAHSETGHNHLFRATEGVKMFRTQDPFVCFLRCETASTLEHLRGFDTHAPILFDVGTYEVRRQREHTPEGFRRIED
jgi:hypothetical protein